MNAEKIKKIAIDYRKFQDNFYKLSYLYELSHLEITDHNFNFESESDYDDFIKCINEANEAIVKMVKKLDTNEKF